MKFLYQHQESGFVRTHQPCPCGQHQGCYSERADKSGYCFSCSQNIVPNKPAIPSVQMTHIHSPKPSPILHTVPDDNIHPSMFGVTNSPFCRTCERVTGRKPYSYYAIGAFGNDVLFWYRDFERVVRNKKTVRFQSNGFNRRKDVHPHSITGAFMPFWGEEHLPRFPRIMDVFVVESEKTAIYCQFVFHWALWLGCGGATGCTRRKIERVKHLLAPKRLFVLFDNDDGGKSGTETALANFKRCGLSANAVSVSDLFPNAPKGFDMADCILAGSGVQL